MITLAQVKTLHDIRELRELYGSELVYVQDLNAEENVWKCSYYQIYMDSVLIGYCCIDKEKTLWEFYLLKSDRVHAQEVFKLLIDQELMAAAECKSYDHLLMSLCLDYHKKSACSAYLFREVTKVQDPVIPYKDITFRMAEEEDYAVLAEHDRIAEGVNFFHDLKEDIDHNEVFIFYAGQEFIGSGTVKKIWSGFVHRDIGMLVPEQHRYKGIGTYIIIKLIEYCRNNKLIPVCGCWYFNYASKKTLERAGFLAEHRMIRFEF